jgi:hypothetical protein
MPFRELFGFWGFLRSFLAISRDFYGIATGMTVAQRRRMRIDQRPQTKPWKTGLLTAEQIESYRKAIEPLQEALAATKAARQGIFKWLKGRVSAQEA